MVRNKIFLPTGFTNEETTHIYVEHYTFKSYGHLVGNKQIWSQIISEAMLCQCNENQIVIWYLTSHRSHVLITQVVYLNEIPSTMYVIMVLIFLVPNVVLSSCVLAYISQSIVSTDSIPLLLYKNLLLKEKKAHICQIISVVNHCFKRKSYLYFWKDYLVFPRIISLSGNLIPCQFYDSDFNKFNQTIDKLCC